VAKSAAAAEAPAERGKAQAHVSDLSPKVIHLIAEEMAVEEAELTPSASFRDDLSLDEIDVAELLVRAEETFGLKQEFDDEEWENCHTVGDFIQLVENRMAADSRRGSGGHAGASAGATRPRKTSRE
jgi:acyl carrier protein